MGPSAARAQVFGALGTRGEGPGFKVGHSLVLHPGFALIAGHDSNILYSNAADPDVMGPYIALRPMLDLATRPPDRGGNAPHTLDFRLHIGGSFRFYMTGDQQFNKQHITEDLDASLLLTLFPFGNWVFDIYDNYGRLSTPPYFRILRPGNVNTDRNDLGLRLRWRPGGRRLEVSLQYQFGLYAFEPDPVSSLFADKNYLSNDIQLRISWKFFPKTSIYLNFQETIYTYFNRGQATPADNYPFRAVFGLMGLITPKLTVNINAGYANGFYAYGPSPENATVLASGTWSPTLRTQLSLVYNHDFNVSLVGSYQDLDRIQLTLSQMIWRILGTLRVAWEERRYQGNLQPDGVVNGRTDDLLLLHLDFSFPIKPWLFVAVGDDVELNFSNCRFIINGAPSAVACDYKRNDFWGRLTVTY